MANVQDWDVVDANNNATPPDGWPENTMQYSEVNDTGRQVQGATRRMWGDINGSLAAGGVADAYTISLNNPYTAYFDGMYFLCSIPADNTGAATIDVNGLGAQAIQIGGSALSGAELQAGSIYLLHYDGTNFQLLNASAGGGGAISQATLTNSNAPDLVDTDVALRVGAVDPDASPHIEVGPADIQSKADQTTTATLEINRLGGNVEIGSKDVGESGRVQLWYSNGVTGVGPTVETTVSGMILEGTTGSSTILDFHEPGGNLQFRQQYNGANMVFDGFRDSMVFDFQSRNTSSTLTQMMLLDPDDDVKLYDEGVEVARTLPPGSGGFEVNNTLTGAGFERVLTVSDLGGGGGVNSVTAGTGLNDTGTAADPILNVDDPLSIQSMNPQSNLPVNATGSPYVNTALNVGGNLVGTQGIMQINRQNIQTRPSSFGFNSTLFININGTGTNGSNTFIGGLNSAGIEVDFGVAVRLRHGSSSVDVVETTTPAAGGLLANNQATGAGLERVLTTSDLGGGGGAQISGTPANNQLAVWVNSTDIEGEPALTYDDSPASQQFQLRNTSATSMRIAAFGIGTSDNASLFIEQEDSGDGLEIVSDNQVIDEVAFYKTDGNSVRTNKVMEFNSNDGVELFFLGNKVAETALPGNGGFRVQDNDVLAPVLIVGGEQLTEGRAQLGGFSSEDIGIVTVTINNANIKTYNGRVIDMNNGDTLRFGSISGGGTAHAGGILTTQTSTNGITIGVDNINLDFWEISSASTIYHNISGTSSFSVSGPGLGAWRYQGTAQVVGFLFNP